MRLWSEWPGRGASIDWDRFSLHEPQETVRSRKKNLRPHQREALDAVVGGLEASDRGKLVMACGTGKTFTSLRIAERLAQHGSGRVLFSLPRPLDRPALPNPARVERRGSRSAALLRAGL